MLPTNLATQLGPVQRTADLIQGVPEIWILEVIRNKNQSFYSSLINFSWIYLTFFSHPTGFKSKAEEEPFPDLEVGEVNQV